MARLPKFLGSHNFQESLTLQRRGGNDRSVPNEPARALETSVAADAAAGSPAKNKKNQEAQRNGTNAKLEITDLLEAAKL
jgi:hypothetical protein